MAYYDALIAKWAQAPAGTEEQKLAWINAQTVVGDALPMKVQYSEIYNRLDRAEYNLLPKPEDKASVQRHLAQQVIDFGPGSAARAQFFALFPSGVSRTNLNTYVAQFDAPKIPWPTAPLAKSGGGLNGMVSHNDLVAAGIVP